jgi:hypothetical protein
MTYDEAIALLEKYHAALETALGIINNAQSNWSIETHKTIREFNALLA